MELKTTRKGGSAFAPGTPTTIEQDAAMAWLKANGGSAVIGNGKSRRIICRGMVSERKETVWGDLVAKGYLAVEGSRLVLTTDGGTLECGPDEDTADHERRLAEAAVKDLAREPGRPGGRARARRA